MNGRVLFRMDKLFRQFLIKRNLFYVEEAQRRLLSQFDNIGNDADRAANEWQGQNGQHFNPDPRDPATFYEDANEVGDEFYMLLSGMREQIRLSVVAGIFHERDKQLRDWLTREIRQWHSGDNATLKVWSAKFCEIVDLLESFGWNVHSADYFRTLDACRLVVNAYKHGEGSALDELRNTFPEYFDHPLRGIGGVFSDTKHCKHEHLRVTDPQLQAFSDAIVAFWRDAPEIILDSQTTNIPKWLHKAIIKDCTDLQQANKND